jgi:hypothetical protein
MIRFSHIKKMRRLRNLRSQNEANGGEEGKEILKQSKSVWKTALVVVVGMTRRKNLMILMQLIGG